MMRLSRLMLIVPLLMTGCASGAGNAPPSVEPDQATWTEPERIAESSGSRTIGIVGTPFYALAKGIGCVASVIVATPVAIGLSLSERDDRDLIRGELDRGVGANCGGSYALAPY